MAETVSMDVLGDCSASCVVNPALAPWDLWRTLGYTAPTHRNVEILITVVFFTTT